MYNLFRGLSASSFLSFIFLFTHWARLLYSTRDISVVSSHLSEILLSLLFLVAGLIFLKRANERGKLYITGVFDSVIGYFSK